MKRLLFLALLFLPACSKENIWGLFKFNTPPKKEHIDTIVRVKEAKELEIIDYDTEEQ